MPIKIFDLDSLTDEQRQAYVVTTGTMANLLLSRRIGILGGRPFEPVLNYIKAPCEEIIGELNNAQIILGRDRPNMIMGTGYMAKGAQHAASVDLVVGRMAAVKPAHGTFVNPSFKADAARIVISETTDIDDNFGIASGMIGSSKGRSGIGIKADGVRIIGREGIKIVTGARTPDGESTETNSKGMELLPVPKIELNAGNIDPETLKPTQQGQPNPLQGVGRGENIVSAFYDLVQTLDSLCGAIDNYMLLQTQFNTQTSTVVSTIPFIGQTVAAGNMQATAQQVITAKSKLHPIRYTLKRKFKQTYLSTHGDKFLASSNVIST
tara:strand:+ start:1501 stop:2469 length:969 start_codon:yes stop_codon:yes gene_type:complete